MDKYYTRDSLHRFALSVLQGFGCEQHEAHIVADHLIDANLTGHDSHGIGMLPMYGDQVSSGNLIPNQTPAFHDHAGAVCLVDAQRGFGHHMALLGLDYAMRAIPQHRVAILGLRNSGHISRVGTYSEYCAKQGYVSIHMANVVGHAPLVAPFGAREAAFSTNPVSMAVPIDGVAKPLLDLATSKVAFGKVRVASNKGESMPEGCLIDKQGASTTNPDPMALNRSGALSAFGEHKGSGLGIFVELLAGALVSNETVATFEHLPSGVINNMFSIILDPQAFYGNEALGSTADTLYRYIKNKDAAVGVSEVLLPGDPENASREHRIQHGIPVDDETIRQILQTATLFNLNPETLRSHLSEATH